MGKNQAIPENECTGCLACVVVCPMNAIEVTENFGFIEPIRSSICIGCGACKKICPVLHEPAQNESPLKVYSSWSTSKDNIINSSSGGIFFEIANYVINHGEKFLVQ